MQEREARELETNIAAWRARMSAALPGQEETVRELEAHLRDHSEVKTREGMTAEAALAEGVKRMGEPRAVAREFDRVPAASLPLWWETVVIYGVLAMASTGVLWLAGREILSSGKGWLLAVQVAAITLGYLGVVGAGLLGGCVLVTGWRHELTKRECESQRREIFRLTAVSSVLVAVGIALGMVWAAKNLGRAWSWAPVEIGALAVLISTGLLLLVMQRRAILDERVRALLALLGATVVGVGWLGANALTPVPTAWLCGAAILTQGAVALLQVRARRAAGGERAVPAHD